MIDPAERRHESEDAKMYCPRCGAQATDEDAFCGSCGADLRSGMAEEPPTGQESAPAPTQPLPTPVAPTVQMPSAAPPTPEGVGPGVPPQQPYSYSPTYDMSTGAVGAAPKRSGLKVAIAAAAVFAILAAVGVVAAIVLLRDGREPPAEPPAGQSSPGGESSPTTPASGPRFSTPEDALEAELPEGWVYTLVNDLPQQKEFWAGPPQSEYVSVYLVEPTPDGGWAVTDVFPLEMSDVPLSEEEQAQYLVEDFLYAIMEDRPEDAQALTVEPFSSDPASASFGGGSFTDFTIEAVEPEGDGTYWVLTSEIWYGRTERYKYLVVPTEAGWRISNATVR